MGSLWTKNQYIVSLVNKGTQYIRHSFVAKLKLLFHFLCPKTGTQNTYTNKSNNLQFIRSNNLTQGHPIAGLRKEVHQTTFQQ